MVIVWSIFSALKWSPTVRVCRVWVEVCLLSVQPMLTVAAAAVPAGGAAPVGAWGAATEDPAAMAAEAVGGGACWSRRARWPSLTIWMMASASASSWRTAAWMLLAEPKLLEPSRWEQKERSFITCKTSGYCLHTLIIVCICNILPNRPVCLAFLLARRVSSRSWMMTCSTRKKNFCVDVLEVSELIQGSCSSRPPSVLFCAATITTLSEPSNLCPNQQMQTR